MPIGKEIGRDRIGQSALLADLFHQSRRKTAAADDVVQDIGRDEIVVAPRDPAETEFGDGLRHIHFNDFARRPERRLGVHDLTQVRFLGTDRPNSVSNALPSSSGVISPTADTTSLSRA